MRTGRDWRSEPLEFHSSRPFADPSVCRPSADGAGAAGALGTPDSLIERVQMGRESLSGEESVGHGTALFALRAALPLAFSLWGLIAALIWACRA